MAIDWLAVIVAVNVSVPPGVIDAARATARLKVKERAAGVWVAVETAGSVAVARTGVLEAVGATGVFVGGMGALVGGTGALVGVLVGGTGVLVGVAVGGTGVLVAVAVGGTGVLVAVTVGVAVGVATVTVPALSCQA